MIILSLIVSALKSTYAFWISGHIFLKAGQIDVPRQECLKLLHRVGSANTFDEIKKVHTRFDANGFGRPATFGSVRITRSVIKRCV